ncbi:MAG: 1-aminocyclopropane-1-carboxylate deaminase/D-cysteine desulfhydrase [Ilyomonas sp.]
MIIQDHAKDRSIITQKISSEWLTCNNVLLDVLRLDELHPVISGNKWFKLKYYLEEAKAKGLKTVATFGGAYSNHIAATAYACKLAGLKSIGIIRGEKPKELSHTLLFAHQNNMELNFVSRQAYKNKEAMKETIKNVYWIDEGGYGTLGLKGASEILQQAENFEEYTHIVSAVGTGTTLAGIIKSALPHQNIVGISVMKGNTSLAEQVKDLLPDAFNFTIVHDYHFGGYARYTNRLLSYMNELWNLHQLPTDFVYTAKTLYAVQNMILKKSIPKQSKVLMIHTGGLQGNLSLPYNSLRF